MSDLEKKLLFEVMYQVLLNQRMVMRHIGISKSDSEYGWDGNDEDTTELLKKCHLVSNSYDIESDEY